MFWKEFKESGVRSQESGEEEAGEQGAGGNYLYFPNHQSPVPSHQSPVPNHQSPKMVYI
ncbi:MAG: hypothetical protein ACKO2Z_02390 [Sphaerospermopsis kisseleviana]